MVAMGNQDWWKCCSSQPEREVPDMGYGSSGREEVGAGVGVWTPCLVVGALQHSRPNGRHRGMDTTWT